jgi:sugar-specific transcriptional regulator TrmB
MIEKQYVNMFLALGQEESEAKILALLVKGTTMSPLEIEKASELSRGKVYQVLGKLIQENKLYKTDDRPALYGITDHFLDFTKENITKILNNVVPQIMRAKRRTQNQIIQETLDVFQTLGYLITEVIPNDSVEGFSLYDIRGFYDYVAEGEYRFAISFIDETKTRTIKRIIESRFVLPIIIEQNRLGCISSFFIIKSDFELADKFMNCINSNKEEITTNRFRQISEVSRFIGIEKQIPFMIKSSEAVTSFVSKTILELHSNRKVINQEVKKIQK